MDHPRGHDGAAGVLKCICAVWAGEKETRAWTIRAGMTAPQAAGVIHTDFEKGFIRAETVAYDDFTTAGGLNQAKDIGRWAPPVLQKFAVEALCLVPLMMLRMMHQQPHLLQPWRLER